MIQTRAYARAGLIGNPSDGYFGKTISFIVQNFSATVTLYESPRLTILPQRSDRLEFANFGELLDDVQLHGYYGGIRLIKAAIKRFGDYCATIGAPINRNFSIEYHTDIPIRVGLAGSSAIITATMRALMQFFGVEIPKPVLPGIILSVELDELKIGAGLQDRVIQVYEGVGFHGLRQGADGAGRPRPVRAAGSGGCFRPSTSRIMTRWRRGPRSLTTISAAATTGAKTAVHAGIKRWAELTQQARDLILAGRGREIGPLMDANFDLRASLIHISPGNRALVETGRKLGAAVNFAGSGGAVVGSYDGDPERLRRLAAAYQELGAKLIVPQIA